MRKVTPYRSISGALKSIDNGGRFFNLMSKADDGIVTDAELAKAAGVYRNAAKMHLFLKMSIMDLSETDRITSAFSPELRRKYKDNKPLVITPREGNDLSLVGRAVIVSGIPKYLKSKTEFSGFIMVPIMVNNVMTMMMIPIMDQYDVYEIYNDKSDSVFLVAHARSSKKFPEKLTRLGGFLKELKKEKDANNADSVFLDTCYYTPL